MSKMESAPHHTTLITHCSLTDTHLHVHVRRWSHHYTSKLTDVTCRGLLFRQTCSGNARGVTVGGNSVFCHTASCFPRRFLFFFFLQLVFFFFSGALRLRLRAACFLRAGFRGDFAEPFPVSVRSDVCYFHH